MAERIPTRVLMTGVDVALMTDAITTNALRADGELDHGFDCNAATMLGVSRCQRRKKGRVVAAYGKVRASCPTPDVLATLTGDGDDETRVTESCKDFQTPPLHTTHARDVLATLTATTPKPLTQRNVASIPRPCVVSSSRLQPPSSPFCRKCTRV